MLRSKNLLGLNMNKHTLTTALILGLIASVVFIVAQPLFGMATLTSRHASAYVNYGSYSETSAVILSWLLHIGVSIFYTLLSTLIFNINHSLFVNFSQIIALGWISTLFATPANEWVVKLVTTQQLPLLESLSALNTQIGPKLWLHILFFTFVICGLLLKNNWLKRAA